MPSLVNPELQCYWQKLATRPFHPSMVPPPAQAGRDDFVFRPHPELAVEIGCGVGLHPIRYALEHPQQQMIALEHTREKFLKFSRRIANHGGIGNLLPVHANAISWICHYLPPQSVRRYFLLYPNPYPKNQHRNKRWYAMPFMDYLLKTLKSGGSLTIATNLAIYAEETTAFLSQYWQLHLEKWEYLQEDKTSARQFRARTHFEKKYLEGGQTCHNLVFRKP